MDWPGFAVCSCCLAPRGGMFGDRCRVGLLCVDRETSFRGGLAAVNGGAGRAKRKEGHQGMQYSRTGYSCLRAGDSMTPVCFARVVCDRHSRIPVWQRQWSSSGAFAPIPSVLRRYWNVTTGYKERWSRDTTLPGLGAACGRTHHLTGIQGRQLGVAAALWPAPFHLERARRKEKGEEEGV